MLGIKLPNFKGVAKHVILVLAHLAGNFQDLLFHFLNGFFDLLLLHRSLKFVELLQLINIVLDLNNLLHQHVPPLLTFALNHIVRILIGQLNQIRRLTKYLRLVRLIRDGLHILLKLTVDLADIQEQVVLNHELHVRLKLHDDRLLRELIVKVRSLVAGLNQLLLRFVHAELFLIV